MKDLKNLQVSTLPIYFNDSFKDSFKEIIYFGRRSKHKRFSNYGDIIPVKYELIDFDKYWMYKTKFKNPLINNTADCDYIAFGILVNVYNTKILPIDLDNKSFSKAKDLIDILLKNNNIIATDLIQSSKENWHILIGLKEYMNIRHIIGAIPGICHGFAGCVQSRREAVLRVSQKFFRDDSESKDIINYVELIRKDIDGNPVSVDINFPKPNVEEIPIKRTIKLRD
jgi:hypothetical protein